MLYAVLLNDAYLSVCFSLARRLVLPWFLPILLLLPGGCQTHTSPTAHGAQSPTPAPALTAPSSAVQPSAEYRRAVACVASHRYREALAILDGLRQSPAFANDPARQSFLNRQRFLCLRALGDKQALVPTSVPSPPRPISPADCGPRALLLVCQEQNMAASLSQLKQQAGTTASGTSLAGLAKAAKGAGLKVRGVQVDRQALSQLSSPAIAWVDGNHYVAVLSVNGDAATIHDPNKTGKETISTEDLLRRCGGVLLTLSR